VTDPRFVLVIVIVAILGTGTISIIYAIWLVGWIACARTVRSETMVAVVIIYSMADIVLNILTAASLSFLGVGVQPPNPEWGLMTYPGLTVLITGAAFGLIGDGLARALRPKG
jgi:peptide/nickel transport system permease protein